MCRDTRHGGRRCPAHQDPAARRARSVRQRVSRYARRLDEAEADGNEPALDRYTRLLQTAFQDMQHMEAPPTTPPTRAAEFTPESTVDLTDEQLASRYAECEGDPLAQEAIMGCFDWRDQLAAEVNTEVERDRTAQEAEQRAWAQASSTARAEDPDGVARSSIHRRSLTRDQQVREEYDTYIYSQMLQAEDDCSGVLLNRNGVANHIDPLSLFEGPAARAKKYASEELQLWWREHGRLSFQAFRHHAREADVDPSSRRAEQDRAAAQRNKVEDFANV